MRANEDSTSRYTVPALARGLELLGHFSRQERELSGALLAKRTRWPRASVFRMLQTLEQAGFVERVGEGTNYKLGVAVLKLGFEYLSSMELTEYGLPILETLSQASGYSAHIVVRDGKEVVFVAKTQGRQALFHSIQVGARLPAHATVIGRVLLADISLQALEQLYAGDPMPRYSSTTPASVAALKAMVDAHASQGHGVSQGGYEPGISTVAAPVFDGKGQVCAAISITIPAGIIEATRVKLLSAQVRDAAHQLSARMRHMPSVPHANSYGPAK